MPSASFSLTGIEALKDKLTKLAPQVRKEVMGEAYRWAEETMTESKRRCPLKTGTLMNSGHVECPELGIGDGGSPAYSFGEKPADANDGLVVLGYGGAAKGYALYVHEAMEGSQPPSPNWSWTKAVAAGKEIQWTRPGSGPKFLENPVKETQNQLPGRLRAAAERVIK